MKLVISVAVFGLFFGFLGCSNQTKFAGRQMAAADASANAPAASVDAAAEAKPEGEKPAVDNSNVDVDQPPVTPPVVVNQPPVVQASKWDDITTAGSGAASCTGSAERCTFKQLATSMKVTAKLGAMPWASANSRCAGLNYNGVSSWRLPTKDELKSIFTDRYEDDVWSKAGWGGNYWSSSIYTNYTYAVAYYVNLTGGSEFDSIYSAGGSGVDLDQLMRAWNGSSNNVLCVQY